MPSKTETVSDDLLDRIANVHVEMALLAALLADNSLFGRAVSLIEIDDFYLPANRYLYAALQSLWENDSPADLILLENELARQGNLGKLAPDYLGRVVATPFTTGSFDRYAAEVRKLAGLRRIVHASTAVTIAAFESDAAAGELTAVVDELHTAMDSLSNQTTPDAYWLRDLLGGVVDRIEERVRDPGNIQAVRSGFHLLDSLLNGGLRAGNLVLVAGRPGMGKTALAMAIASNAAGAGRTVAYFSMEMTSEELVERLIPLHVSVTAGDIKSGKLSADML